VGATNGDDLNASVIDAEWQCPACGYLLRGLPHDPVRCPECGRTWTVEELRRLHEEPSDPGFERGQTLAAVGIGAFLLIVLGVGLSWVSPLA